MNKIKFDPEKAIIGFFIFTHIELIETFEFVNIHK